MILKVLMKNMLTVLAMNRFIMPVKMMVLVMRSFLTILNNKVKRMIFKLSISQLILNNVNNNNLTNMVIILLPLLWWFTKKILSRLICSGIELNLLNISYLKIKRNFPYLKCNIQHNKLLIFPTIILLLVTMRLNETGGVYDAF